MLLAAWAIPASFIKVLAAIHWDRYLLLVKRSADPEAAVERLTSPLESVLQWTPDDSLANLRLAALRLSQFSQAQRKSDNPMSLAAVRDAALASQFASHAALEEWLARAVGPPRWLLEQALVHARRGLANAPLRGEGYLYLAQLGFVESPDAARTTALLDQALRVRPDDGEVLLRAGEEAFLAGHRNLAIDYWKRCFHAGSFYQARLVDLLAPRVPAAFFLEFLQPDLEGLRLLHDRYKGLGQADQVAQIVPPYALAAAKHAAASKGAEAARAWFEAHRMYAALADQPRALYSAQQAVALSPNSFEFRSGLAGYLYQHQRFEEAEEHLRWCRRRKPSDKSFEQMLEVAIKQRIDRQTSPTR